MRGFVRWVGILFFWGGFCASSAFADSLCNYYREELPYMYRLMCTDGGSATTKPAGVNSTFSDSFNVSAAALPTEPSSYGIEIIESYLRRPSTSWSPTFSIIKGFHKFGTGVSTGGNNTFFGNDIVQRAVGTPDVDSFSPHEPAKSSIPNLNLGTSFQLVHTRGGYFPNVDLGFSVRHNKITDTWGGGPAFLLSWKYLTLGAGFTRERVSNYLPIVTFTSFLASTRISILELEYTQLRNYGGFALDPIHILSATLSLGHFMLIAAERKLNYLQWGSVVQTHYALQYMVSKSWTVGAMYNYIPGADSVAMQWFL